VTDRARLVRETQRRTWSHAVRDYAKVSRGRGAITAQLMARVRPRAGERVLDVGTGTGAAATAAAEAVGPTGQVLATDLVPEWGEFVAAGCAAAGVANVEFRAMGAEALELPDASFDLVVSQCALMFVPEPDAALREMRRVLRDGGRLGLAIWSTLDRVEHLAVGGRVLARHDPAPPPAERQPTPTELGEPGLIERLVAEAGFREIEAERLTIETTYLSADAYWRHQTLPEHTRAALARLPSERVEVVRAEMTAELEVHRRGEEFVFASEAIYVTARR
jgi:SAM-dependent methyltransferase